VALIKNEKDLEIDLRDLVSTDIFTCLSVGFPDNCVSRSEPEFPQNVG
jgi:hypothetical protein